MIKNKLQEVTESQIAAEEALKNLSLAIDKYVDATAYVNRVTKEFGDILKNLDIPYIDALEAENNG